MPANAVGSHDSSTAARGHDPDAVTERLHSGVMRGALTEMPADDVAQLEVGEQEQILKYAAREVETSNVADDDLTVSGHR